jgi:glutamate-1-semialdehyde 2,1-aminomutase
MALAKSAQWLERSQKVLAGGVSSDVRRSELPHPLFFRSGKGSRIYDIDGNEYIDYVLGQGPLLLGHSPRPVLDAVHRQLEQGLVYAAQHEAETELAELLTEVIPCAERVRFNSTGSEAVITALRIARAYRNRPLVVKFEGQWHGWYDSLFISTSPSLEQAGPGESPAAVMPSQGQVRNAAENVVVMPWNNLELLAALFQRRGNEIAAVITEPMMCNAGSIAPLPGFLEGLRQLCNRFEITLIFDEVITGFRLGLGGAQEAFGVVPDLATYAKGIASGFTLSAVAGKAEWMDLISSGKVVHAGTYNSNPVVIAAGLATVRHLMENRETLYARLYQLGDRLRDGLRSSFSKAGLPALIGGLGPVVQVSLTEAPILRDYRDWIRRDTATYQRLVARLVPLGVRTITRGTWYLSTAHTEEDVQSTLEKADSALQQEG